MTEALVGGLFALLAGWLAVGGRRRRERAALKEEFEILQLLEPGHPNRAELQSHADQRLSVYLHPPDLGKLTWQGLTLSAVVAILLLQARGEVGIEPTSRVAEAALGAATGALAVLLVALGRLIYILAIPAKRVAFFAAIRQTSA